MRIALAQINVVVGDLTGNSQKILDSIRQAKDFQADLVAFPELVLCGYPPEDLLLKDYFVRDTIKVLQELRRQVKGIVVIVGFVDQGRDKRVYNAAAVISGRRVAGIYHKHELPNYGVFDEKRYFSEGKETPFFRLNGEVFGVNICEDIWTEGRLFSRQMKQKLPLMINISASPYDYGKLEERERILKARARMMQAYVCYVNMVGGQDELVFDGGSEVIDPRGRVIAHARQFEEDLLVADIALTGPGRKIRPPAGCVDLGAGEEAPKTLVVLRQEKRYSRIERVMSALVLGTRDYVQKNGFKKVVVGLSGGIDSSLVAVIASQAVGPENVTGISMPSRFTSAGTQTDARVLAENLGIAFKEIMIDTIFQSYLSVMESEFHGLPFNVAEENIQARIRGNILMAFSNKFGWLMLNTGNKSEVAVGYCTLYGDLSGGFAVIKDIPKMQVFELARLVNQAHPGLIPDAVLKRAPSAELRDNQTDQDSLPPYADLDPLLKAYVEEHQSLAKLLRINPDKAKIQDIIRMVDRSEYKRRQSPPGIKISPRAFGRDWRLPITNKYQEKEG